MILDKLFKHRVPQFSHESNAGSIDFVSTELVHLKYLEQQLAHSKPLFSYLLFALLFNSNLEYIHYSVLILLGPTSKFCKNIRKPDCIY